MPHFILTVNTGSSSIKATLYEMGDPIAPRRKAAVDRIGAADAAMRVTSSDGSPEESRLLAGAGFETALAETVSSLTAGTEGRPLAVGHRVVHGGPRYSAPQRVTPELREELRRLVPIDPQHLPQAIAAMLAAQRLYPAAVQVACFDTAFHRDMPRVAQTYPLPYPLIEEGVLRYGFHGLSYESIVSQLREMDALPPRMVVAHLGNGSSMAAILNGRSADTTMGFTPTGGLMMGTRCGDIDPGVAIYLQQSHGLSPEELSALFNQRSGLLGVSGLSGDMRDVLAAEDKDSRAKLAVDLYCFVARKYLASMVASTGGIDVLVFTGGIGEHGAEVRKRVCEGLQFLGIALDEKKNEDDADVISRPDTVTVRVMHTDEDAVIARHTADVLRRKDDSHVHV